jgi:nucleotide-binding universal stress UspA family protein
MEKLHSVLVGVDFSDCSVNALREAGRLATRDGAKLHVAHMVTPDFVEHYRESSAAQETDIIEKLRSQVKQFADAHLGASGEFEASVFIGHPFDELVRAAVEFSADLLVLGSHGLTVDSHSIGNIASKCVRKAPLPVLLVRDSHRGTFKKVVAGVDFSDTSFTALREAALIAGRDGADLQVLHVHCPPWLWANHYAYDLQAFPKKDYEIEYRAILKDEMAAFVAPVRTEFPELKLTTEIVEDEAPLRGIRKHLKAVEADVVVIGSRGRSGIKSLLLGTTAERLLQDSPCSVITVKPDGFEYKV